jgi:8-hydroxy-5-deazaflavin:NADPH oxidoreductase
MIVSRDPAELHGWLRDAGPQAEVGTFAVVLSVNGRAAEDVMRLAGVENLAGKIVLDASDRADSSGRPGLFVGTTDSLGERIQRLIPDAYVVKGLNIVVAEVMINPRAQRWRAGHVHRRGQRRAKHTVPSLLGEFGWPVIDMGGIESARWLEALSLAWVVYSHRTGKTHHAFKLVGK